MYVSYFARVKRLKILYCIKSGQCLLIAGCTSLEEAEKNIEGNAVTDFSISSLPPGKRKRFTRRNYLWIESLNCIGKGPSSLTKAGIPIANFSTLLLSESNQCTLCSARKLTNSGKKKPGYRKLGGVRGE